MSFIPNNTQKEAQAVPYFEDISGQDGWQGHATSKSLDRLQDEITASIKRLGGVVIFFQRGEFRIGDTTRQGYQIRFFQPVGEDETITGRLDIAALPVKKKGQRRFIEARQEKSLKMALYMLRMALDGLWFLQQLSPGYAPLMPWTLTNDKSGMTISQAWSDRVLNNLLLTDGGYAEYREFTESNA